MLKTAQALIDICGEKGWKISDYVLEEESKGDPEKKEQILSELRHMLAIMKDSTSRTLEEGSGLKQNIINDFGKKTWDYSKSGKPFVTDEKTLRAMARAFSTFESNAKMDVIVAAPTAGSCGIVPAALVSAQEDIDVSDDDLVKGLLTAIGIGQFIGGYGTFAGAEGGCQAECGA
ncbi:L-serine ammonia-lyase, iron-sulfur-dependent, subunit alpha, partial [Aedoeadaptatus coxii]